MFLKLEKVKACCVKMFTRKKHCKLQIYFMYTVIGNNISVSIYKITNFRKNSDKNESTNIVNT